MNKPMRSPRKAIPTSIATNAWWYEGETHIEVFTERSPQSTGVTLSSRIEKRQIIGWLRRLGYTVEKTP